MRDNVSCIPIREYNQLTDSISQPLFLPVRFRSALHPARYPIFALVNKPTLYMAAAAASMPGSDDRWTRIHQPVAAESSRQRQQSRQHQQQVSYNNNNAGDDSPRAAAKTDRREWQQRKLKKSASRRRTTIFSLIRRRAAPAFITAAARRPLLPVYLSPHTPFVPTISRSPYNHPAVFRAVGRLVTSGCPSDLSRSVDL